jgi:phosphopantetheinyl transferase
MQAVESQTLILYYSDLRGQWPQEPARALAAKLRYAKRLEVEALAARAPATLAGIALALHGLARLTGSPVGAADLAFPAGGKPRLVRAQPADTADAAHAGAPPDFSISHSGPWVGCAAVAHGRVGFDVELGTGDRLAEWTAREAALKACGAGIAAAREVQLRGDLALCRGVRLHARTLGLFPGAMACVMTSLPLSGLEARAIALAELFAP